MNYQNLASDQNTRARTRRKRHATRSPSDLRVTWVLRDTCTSPSLSSITEIRDYCYSKMFHSWRQCMRYLVVRRFFFFLFLFCFFFGLFLFFFLSSPVDIATVSLFRLRAFRGRLFCPREALPLQTSPVNCLAVSSHWCTGELYFRTTCWDCSHGEVVEFPASKMGLDCRRPVWISAARSRCVLDICTPEKRPDDHRS